MATMIVAAMPAPSLAVFRQAIGSSQNFEPTRIFNVICLTTVNYAMIADGNLSYTPGFCPVTGQASYQLTLTFNRPYAEYATRLVVWSNAGNIFTDSELRTFDLQVNHTDPMTGQPLVYTRTNVQIADTLNASTPVFHDFVNASNVPIRLYGITSVIMSNLRNAPESGASAEAAFREVQVDTTLDTTRFTDVRVTKTSALFAENALPNFAIPSNDVIYAITVANHGNLAVDPGTVLVLDQLPSRLTFYNGDANGSLAGSDVIIWQDGGSGLTFPPTALGYATVAPASFNDCSYTPVAGYDPLVRYICVRPTGALRGALASPYPAFTLQFRMRIN